jgi:hypothetical protein
VSAQATAKQTSAPKAAGSRWKRRLVLLVILGGGVTVGVRALWQHVEPMIWASSHYSFDPRAEMQITPQPAWISGDFKAKVLRDASLDKQFSILDDSLAERIYKAFAMNAWVDRVVRVTKHAPASVDVELVYREPVCMVEVPGGLYPVDSQGMLLPTEGFPQEEARRFPRLGGVQHVTEGPVGTRWRDPHVLGGAKVATVLVDDWPSLQLARISPMADIAGAEPVYELTTTSGARIIWGKAPAADSDEPGPADKIARLKDLATSPGGLGPQSAPVDLRR